MRSASLELGKVHFVGRTFQGGDDFAEYILRAPGAYAYVGSGNPEKPNTELAHHNSCFDIDEDCLKVSVALYSCYTIEYLNGEV